MCLHLLKVQACWPWHTPQLSEISIKERKLGDFVRCQWERRGCSDLAPIHWAFITSSGFQPVLISKPNTYHSKSPCNHDLLKQIIHIWQVKSFKEGKKEMFYLIMHSIHFYLRLYGVRHMVKDHTDSKRGNPLPPHRLLFLISSKCSFICIISQTSTYHSLCYTRGVGAQR